MVGIIIFIGTYYYYYFIDRASHHLLPIIIIITSFRLHILIYYVLYNKPLSGDRHRSLT